MIELCVGDELTYLDGVFRVVGVSPTSAAPRGIYLEEVSNGACTEVDFDEIRREGMATGLADLVELQRSIDELACAHILSVAEHARREAQQHRDDANALRAPAEHGQARVWSRR